MIPQVSKIKDLENNKINNPVKIPANSDLDNYKTPGFFYNGSTAEAVTIANKPDDANVAFSLLVEKHAGVKQTFTLYSRDNPRTWVRNYYSGTWGEWKEVRGQVIEMSMSLINGWTTNGQSHVTKDEKLVHMLLSVRNGTGAVITNLPTNFRPRSNVLAPLVETGGTNSYLQINTNGEVKCVSAMVGKSIMCSCSYYTN